MRLLAEVAPQDGRVLAGGQSLVPIMAFRLARPAHLIDINTVAGLDGLALRDGMLRIEDGIVAAPRICLGGVEAMPRRIEPAEATLSGRRPGEAVFREAAAAAAAEIDPIEDAQTDARYRRELAGTMVYRALAQACMSDRRSRT